MPTNSSDHYIKITCDECGFKMRIAERTLDEDCGWCHNCAADLIHENVTLR